MWQQCVPRRHQTHMVAACQRSVVMQEIIHTSVDGLFKTDLAGRTSATCEYLYIYSMASEQRQSVALSSRFTKPAGEIFTDILQGNVPRTRPTTATACNRPCFKSRAPIRTLRPAPDTDRAVARPTSGNPPSRGHSETCAPTLPRPNTIHGGSGRQRWPGARPNGGHQAPLPRRAGRT